MMKEPSDIVVLTTTICEEEAHRIASLPLLTCRVVMRL